MTSLVEYGNSVERPAGTLWPVEPCIQLVPPMDLPRGLGKTVYCMDETTRMLEPFDLREKLILANKGYDHNKFVCWIEKRGESL